MSLRTGREAGLLTDGAAKRVGPVPALACYKKAANSALELLFRGRAGQAIIYGDADPFLLGSFYI